MLDSGIGENVNVVIQTMGTKEWQEHDISSDTARHISSKTANWFLSETISDICMKMTYSIYTTRKQIQPVTTMNTRIRSTLTMKNRMTGIR